MNNLELAKAQLQKVGALLSKEMSNPAVKKILLKLKAVNNDLNSIINGDSDFSFDDFNESTAPVRARVTESKKSLDADFGVDLGGFDNFVSQKSPETFDWRSTMREANGGGEGVDLGNWNPAAAADANTLGRMIDNT